MLRNSTKEVPSYKLSSINYSQTEPSCTYQNFIKTSKTMAMGMTSIREKGFQGLKVLSNNVNNPRYPGFSEYQSDNSFQNSSYCFSFPKGHRFASSMSVTDKMYSLPQVLSRRSTNMGIGNRKDLRPRPGVGSPSPDAYQIKTCFDFNVKYKKGPKILERYDIDEGNKKNPGPGAYTIASKGNKLLIPIKLKSRLGMFYDDDLKKTAHCVSMQKYHPKTKLEENMRFTKITFGIGNRSPNENICVKSNPGPGSYKVPGCFEKGYRKKLALN